jgi:hypothetical protein
MTVPCLVNVLCDNAFYAIIHCIEICSLLLFQPNFADAEVSEKDLGLPPVNMVSSQVPEVSSEPDPSDRTTKHIGRIADPKG